MPERRWGGAVAFSNATDYAKIVTVEGIAEVYFTQTDSLTDVQKKAIAAIKETQSGKEVKLHDKMRALELLVMDFWHCACVSRMSENAFTERYQK